ncbi:hypothetical protein MGALJ_39660 [Mycobacterium gallinarum]|uniref:Uncharacterized protein n=1 Tax=Mycobacterium gallinarum TaxID=39689 RepID=A0A9W4B5L4_9MYCO|nr:hypothetical protein MGALJ_39660 [Mycobacterium gallinarum]
MNDFDTGRGGDAINIVAKLSVARQSENPGGGSHEPTMRAVANAAPPSTRTLWMNRKLGTTGKN